MKTNMKALLTLLIVLSATIVGYAQTDSTAQDTVKKVVVKEGKRIKVIITEKDIAHPDHPDSIEKQIEELEIQLEGLEGLEGLEEEIERELEEEFEFEFEGEKKREIVTTDWFNMQLGLNNLLNSDNRLDMPEGFENMSISTGKSVDFHLHIVQQALNIYKKNVRFVYGVGIDFNNYRFEKDVILGQDSTGFLTANLDEEISYKKNKLNTQYLTVPLMLNLRFGHDEKKMFNVSFGPNLGYLLTSHQKLKWDDNGKNKAKVKDDYNIEKFRVGYELQFGYGNFIMFAKYFPNSIFEKNGGPELRTVSAGILLGSI